MNRTRKVLLSGLLTIAGSLGHAQSVTLSPSSPHPEAAVAVSGAHFADSEAIDVYFDTVDTSLLVSTSTGTFGGTVTIPAAAAPGKHYITAIGRRSGDAAQGALTVTTPWVEYGYGAGHLGWNPYENTVSADNVAQLGVLWSAPVNGAGGTPVISNGKAYVGTAAGITALSTATGAVLWTAETSDTFNAAPAVVGGVVYAVSYSSGTVYALAAATGAQIWSVQFGFGSSLPPVVVAGVVYVSDGLGRLCALQASTGNTLWYKFFSEEEGGYDSSPTVANGTLYIGCNQSVCALNAATGALNWVSQTTGYVSGSLAVSDGRVYAVATYGTDAYLYAIRTGGADPGTLVWVFNLVADGEPVGSPAVAYGNVYIASESGGLYALDATFGAVTWNNSELELVGGGVLALANGVAYVDNGDALYAFDAYEGGVLASWNIGAGSPAISDGVVYVNGSNTNPTALSLLAGTGAVRSEPRAPEISTLHPDLTLEVTPR